MKEVIFMIYLYYKTKDGKDIKKVEAIGEPYYVYRSKHQDVYFIKINKEDDPRKVQYKRSQIRVSNIEGEVYHGQVLWLKEDNMVKAAKLFDNHRSQKIAELEQRLQKMKETES